MCTGRFIDAQDDLDRTTRGIAIDKRDSIFSNGADHISNLQGVPSERDCGWILGGGPGATFNGSLAFISR